MVNQGSMLPGVGFEISTIGTTLLIVGLFGQVPHIGKLTRFLAMVGSVAVLALSIWAAFRTWPRKLPIRVSVYPGVEAGESGLLFPFPAKVVLGVVGTFDNELSGFLWFDYVRSHVPTQVPEVLLTATELGRNPSYRIYLVLPNDAVDAIAFLASMKAKGYILNRGDDLAFSSPSDLDRYRAQTRLFVAAYNRPVKRNLEVLSEKQLVPSVARFLVFKSMTDPRVRGGTDVQSLSREQATEMAADIIAVAQFYNLPLDVFLGIGAMENNYLSIRGDLEHAVWKRRPAKDDIILKRRRHRVLVSDYSIGVWQITRETLRFAHDLYLKDKRNYTQLPEQLRPPKVFVLDVSDSHVLTTYAGLLLRDLLDRFHGDVEKAVGAYNGGPRNPNLEYAAGVGIVAEYARNVLGRVSAINRQAIARTTLSIRRAQRSN
jgi:hypothetical protein